MKPLSSNSNMTIFLFLFFCQSNLDLFYFVSNTRQAAVLKTNARGPMINLFGAMSEEGMIYFELLNEDGKKKTGTILTDIWEDFNRIQMLLKESSKKIGIDFLPKYSPFLNPIELVFNIIKIDVKQSGHARVKTRTVFLICIVSSLHPCQLAGHISADI
ncbi:putative signal peptide protein [Puccinia sorghi]|uniref:Putative signal peptide protein n=1 Tax=Puccinia sorghi TaxID=27349 RepID=A0A0L6UY12_9BASI|nr:putative signal peptide protein [Puccinia sorghi]